MSQPEQAAARLGDVIATVVLCVVAVAVSLYLMLGGLLWGAGAGVENSWGLVFGVFGLMVTTVLGIVASIIQLSRHRPGFVVPLITIGVTVMLWWVARTIGA